MILALLLATATVTAAPDPAAKPAEAKAPEKMICRTEVPVGTRFPKKVCRPAASYGAMGAEERKAVEAAQRGWSQCGQANNTRC
jgi:hypothetical protein